MLGFSLCLSGAARTFLSWVKFSKHLLIARVPIKSLNRAVGVNVLLLCVLLTSAGSGVSGSLVPLHTRGCCPTVMLMSGRGGSSPLRPLLHPDALHGATRKPQIPPSTCKERLCRPPCVDAVFVHPNFQSLLLLFFF